MTHERFTDRTVSVTISPEYLQEMTDYETVGEQQRACEKEAQRIEDTHEAVVQVTEPRRGRGFRLEAIAKNRAERADIKRGLESALHYLST